MAAGVGTKIKVLSYKQVSIPKEFAKGLKTGKADKAYRLEMTRLMSSGPQAYSLIYFPLSLGKLIAKDEIRETTEVITLVESKLGTRAQGAHQTMDVSLADAVVAENLEVKPRTPLLVVKREYFSKTGAALFFAESYFRTDRFRYQIELTRVNSSG
jgi:GntR family transcriptional regulator